MNKIFYAIGFCLIGLQASAQIGPGGANANCSLWLKADQTTTTGTSVDTWPSFTGTNTFTGTGTNRPTLATDAINFQPAVTFNGANFMDGPIGALAPITVGNDAYTIFGVWVSTSGTPGTPQRIWSQRANSDAGANDGAGLWLYNGAYGDQPEISPFTHLTTRAYNTGAWNATQLNLYNTATNDFQSFDNRNLSTGGAAPMNSDANGADANGINGADTRILATTQNRLGARMAPPDVGIIQEPFIGQLAELVVYNANVSAAEQARIFSYFALKYGISIGTDVVNSSNTVVWDATANAAYNNDVFGIGLDFGGSLNVSQSNSVNTGSGNGTGVSGAGNIVLSSASAQSNNGFLMLGHDLGALTEGTAEVPPGATTSKRLAREWKAQLTGGIGTVTVAFNTLGLTMTGLTAADFRLMVDADGDGDFTTGTIRYYTASTYVPNGDLTFPNVTLNNNEVFSFITAASSALPVTWKSFTGHFQNDNVHLNWSVENNENGDRYEVEHSTDGVHYSVTGTVKNESDVKSYSYTTGEYSNGANYYRIHQVDIDGKDIYSQVVTISIKASAGFAVKVLNNPVKTTTLKLEVHAPDAIKASVELWSLNGVRVLSRQQMINGGKSQVFIPVGQIPAGSYVLKVRTNDAVRTAGIIKL